MATHQQPSPTTGIPPHHVAQHPAHAQVNGHAPHANQPKTPSQYLGQLTEAVWTQMGSLSEQLQDYDGAMQCYEQALKYNQWSVPAMQGIACILRTKDAFPAAVEYLRTILKVDPANGDVWGSLGHCYLMMDDLQQAYSAYQQALYHLSDPKEPKLWYGIGILYDRYGSLEHAEEAFSQVMRMEPNFEKANEIYFRLGIIYKQQQKFSQSLDCFRYIVTNPPRPLTEEDIWFQIGHVYEQQKEFESAKGAYRRVLERDPNHAKVLQQLGWLHHQQSTNYTSQEQAIEYLEKSVASDQTDAQSWYLLGRCYMSQQKYPKAYEAYQQAVYRDGRNPTFWCSIGVLYYQINQYRDALDAYSRAIRLNPNISEVWYDLGTLYESCNNQTADALDAYQRAADLDPSNVHIKARLQLLQNGQTSAGAPNQGNAPVPQDVHPQAYQPASVHGPAAPQWGAPQPQQPPPGPAPPALAGSGWDRPLAQIRDPGMPPQQLNPYEQREGIRPPTQHAPQRPVSPRQEPPRSYAEPPRPATNGPGPQGPGGPPPPGPGSMRRGMSPSPKTHHVAPSPYHPAPPQLTPQPSQAQPQIPLHQQQQPPNRISNPNYGPHAASVPPPPPPPPTSLGVPAGQGPSQGPITPYGRPASPPPEVRPIVENRAGSPRNGYQGPYQHHPDPSASSGIASGAPPPASALAAAEAAARDRDERPPTAPPKRHREWEEPDHMNPKPPANDEKRQKLEEPHSRRPSPQHRMSSPQVPRHSPQDAPDPRRFNDGYHPSDAAHHPTLPPMGAAPSLPRMSETPKQDRPEHHEPAARHMDVDENYDDDGEDVKPNASKSDRGSPRNAPTNGVPHAPTPVEQKS
ncbi:TPR-like protein [Cucurbitaria berberidis CBS 394.84]|uniref:TPR-like protein n=1 Tax=Cucurbitaria berberidis CBS 394.84 TaxID=1168544 RepID=A0A9P4GV37_9PLEO|nr:TPR-like protein [Cucurbitaria berberidis CBS 394.84]KAF1851862.1 TPR-like protein [Cucurbitaria berberidis CBS 394.84]